MSYSIRDTYIFSLNGPEKGRVDGNRRYAFVLKLSEVEKAALQEKLENILDGTPYAVKIEKNFTLSPQALEGWAKVLKEEWDKANELRD